MTAAVVRVPVLLALSCHPMPTVAVTAFATTLAVVAGNGPGTCALLAAAVLSGQLSIGWCNDRLDAERDAIARRADKPVAMGRLGRRAIDVALAGSVVAVVALSLALGPLPGVIHLGAVAMGWAYNLGVKSTPVSWLPYALAFGALPVVATTALPEPRAPGGWAIAAGALLGVAANLTNVLPDIAADLRTRVRGLGHRLGARRSLLLALATLLAATACVTFGPQQAPRAASWAGLATVIAIASAGLPSALRAPAGRAPFAGLVVITGVNLLVIITIGAGLR